MSASHPRRSTISLPSRPRAPQISSAVALTSRAPRVRIVRTIRTRGAREVSATALLICGALGREGKEIVDRRGWDADIHGESALLHLYPSRILDRSETRRVWT